MSLLRLTLTLLAAAISVSTILAQTKSAPNTYNEVRKLFANPPSEYRTAPLWVWNDNMTEKQIDEELTDFRARGIGGVFIHPRPGLITEYLSDEWLSLCRHAVGKGKELGLKVWIYDENSYPSGFAGGHVPAQMPDAVRSGLAMEHLKELPAAWTAEPLIVLQREGAGFTDITKEINSKTFPPGDYCAFTVIKQIPNPWYGGFSYVDLMRPEVTKKFIDVTMNAYKRAVGDEFGKTVPGVFQDEAEVNPAGRSGVPTVNYTPALFREFGARWEYDLRPNLPSLYEDVGDYRRVRHDFYSKILDLFIGGWAKPYYDYCTQNHLALTGHYWEHEWPRPVVTPDNLALAAFAHIPGIDILMNEFAMDTHAQFGNARAVKEIRSAANQLGRQRTLSETYGAGGWEMSFFDQKRIADWEYVLGVNFVNQHLSYATIKGTRKTDHPLSFSYHEPWWSSYNVLADYCGRLSVVTSLGAQENRILVIEPTTTAWMYYASKGDRAKYQGIEKGFQGFINALEAAQIEYDLASERTIRDHAKGANKTFTLGKRSYDLVVLPPTLENLDKYTLTVLSEYLASGGKVLCYGEAPQFLDGQPSDAAKNLAAKYAAGWTLTSDPSEVALIERMAPSRFVFDVSPPANGEQQLLFHHRRTFKDFELLLLVNTSDISAATGNVTVPAASCEEWNGFAGAVRPYPFKSEKGSVKTQFSIPRGGSLLLCFRRVGTAPGKTASKDRVAIPADSTSGINPLTKNVLAVDYCDLTIGGKSAEDLYFYEAQTKAYQAHGLPVNPWDHAVQYKRNIVEKDKFDPNSGFVATYKFVVAAGVKNEGMEAVVERPELYGVSVNGHEVKPRQNTWWLDKAFGVFDIGKFVIEGENQVVLKAQPFTIHTEIQPVFVRGEFGLESIEKGFRIVPAAQLKLGSWSEQGMPLYGDKVSYTKKVKLTADHLKSGAIFVRLGKWSGVVAEVNVNGKRAGVIGFEPFELEVGKLLKPGENEVSVAVCGSLKNTLGPHHNDPPLGRAWPGEFQQGAKDGRPAGSKYNVVGYGLMEEFLLEAAK